jgi:hypothetical protein
MIAAFVTGMVVGAFLAGIGFAGLVIRAGQWRSER